MLDIISRYGPVLTGAKVDKRKQSIDHFRMEAGGELRSVGASADVESWTFDWIVIDDLLTDPYEIRNPNRRQQVYQDLHTKFFCALVPWGTRNSYPLDRAGIPTIRKADC